MNLRVEWIQYESSESNGRHATSSISKIAYLWFYMSDFYDFWVKIYVLKVKDVVYYHSRLLYLRVKSQNMKYNFSGAKFKIVVE